MNIQVRILGCSGGLPAHGRWCTSQLLHWDNHHILIDAGEGCQMRLQEYFSKSQRISHVFISHLHGDHIFGLPGLISSYTLNRRQSPLTIIGPRGIEAWLRGALSFDLSLMSFELHFVELTAGEEDDHGPVGQKHIMDIGQMQVYAIPMEHRINCNGYIFKSNPERDKKIRSEKIQEYGMSHEDIRAVKSGQDLQRDQSIPNDDLTYPLIEHSYAFCTDTRYYEGLSELLQGIQTVYLECTYDVSLQELALKNYHCTTADVAKVSKEAGIKKMILGHFSGRYADLGKIKAEMDASGVDYVLAEDGMLVGLS